MPLLEQAGLHREIAILQVDRGITHMVHGRWEAALALRRRGRWIPALRLRPRFDRHRREPGRPRARDGPARRRRRAVRGRGPAGPRGRPTGDRPVRDRVGPPRPGLDRRGRDRGPRPRGRASGRWRRSDTAARPTTSRPTSSRCSSWPAGSTRPVVGPRPCSSGSPTGRPKSSCSRRSAWPPLPPTSPVTRPPVDEVARRTRGGTGRRVRDRDHPRPPGAAGVLPRGRRPLGPRAERSGARWGSRGCRR